MFVNVWTAAPQCSCVEQKRLIAELIIGLAYQARSQRRFKKAAENKTLTPGFIFQTVVAEVQSEIDQFRRN